MATQQLLSNEVNNRYMFNMNSSLKIVITNNYPREFSNVTNGRGNFRSTKIMRGRIKIVNNQISILRRNERTEQSIINIFVREGPIANSDESTKNNLFNEIERFRNANIQQDLFLPIGYFISENHYFLVFLVKGVTLAEMFQNTTEFTMKQKASVINKIDVLLKDFHMNGIYGFLLSLRSVLYDRYSNSVALMDYNEIRNLTDPGNLNRDLRELINLINEIFGYEINNWGRGIFNRNLNGLDGNLFSAINLPTSRNLTALNEENIYRCVRDLYLSLGNSDIDEIITMIRNSISQLHLERIRTMTLVIILGHTQVGKSTLINALRGKKYTIINDKLQADPGSVIVNEAMVGNSNESCTILPSVYIDEVHNIAYLDTRGLFDTRNQKNEEVVASILMELAINAAQNIKIAFLERYDDLSISFFNDVGNILSKIITLNGDNVVPCLFLINGYSLKNIGNMKNYSSLTNEEIKQKRDEAILDKISIMCESSQTGSSFQYIRLLAYNMLIRNIGYIDITDSNNISELINNFCNPNLFVNPEDLRFDRYSEQRASFDRKTIPKLIAFTNIINNYLALPSISALESVREHLVHLLENYSQRRNSVANLNRNNNNEIERVLGMEISNEIRALRNEEQQRRIELEEINGELRRYDEEGVYVTKSYRTGGGENDKCTVVLDELQPVWTRYTITPENIQYPRRLRISVNNDDRSRIEITLTNESEYMGKDDYFRETKESLLKSGVDVLSSGPEKVLSAISSIVESSIFGAISFGICAGFKLGIFLEKLIREIVEYCNDTRYSINGEVTLYAPKRYIDIFRLEYQNLINRQRIYNERIERCIFMAREIERNGIENIVNQIERQINEVNREIESARHSIEGIQMLTSFCNIKAETIDAYQEIYAVLVESASGEIREVYERFLTAARTLNQRMISPMNVLHINYNDPNELRRVVDETEMNLNQLKQNINEQERNGVYNFNPFLAN